MGSHQDEKTSAPLPAKYPPWRTVILYAAAFYAVVFSTVALTQYLTPVRHVNYIEELQALIDAHNKHLEGQAALHSRGLLSDLGSSIEGAAGAAASSLLPNTSTILSSLGSALGITGGNGSLVDSIEGGLVEPAKYLGVGLASGAMAGLNMSMPPNITGNVTGLNAIAQNLGSGLSSTIFNSSTFSNLTSDTGPGGLLGGSSGTAGQAVLALGQGLGGGATSGLKLNTVSTMMMFNTSGISGIAGSFGQGLSQSFLGSVDISTLAGSGPGGLLGGSSGMVGQAVLALGQGLGGGASSGLKLNTATSGMMFNTSGVSGIAGSFGQGLSQSFLGSVNLSAITSSLTSSLSKRATDGTSMVSGLTAMIPQIATGFGSGLGQGAAIGLGFQNDSTTNVSGSDVAGITHNFAQGLVASFLANGTTQNLVSSLSSLTSSKDVTTGNATSTDSGLLGGFSLGSIDIVKVAEGLAVGLVSGAGSQITSLQLFSADTTNFNDTVDGAATGFGNGLGSEGAKLVSQVLGTSITSKKSKRAVESTEYVGEKSVALSKRAEVANGTNLAEIIANLNATNINPLIQTGIDDLTCEGVGGLIGVALGLVSSNTISLNGGDFIKKYLGANLTLPDQEFNFTSDGNTYRVNPKKGFTDFSVNNTKLIPLVIIAVLHIVIGIAVFYFAIPLLLLAYSSQRVRHLIQSPSNRSDRGSNSKWAKWVRLLAFSIAPLSILIFAFGVALRGSAKQFVTGHGIFGLLVFLQTLLAAVTTQLQYPKVFNAAAGDLPLNMVNPRIRLVHKANIGLLLFLSMVTLLTGFTDLSALSVCVTASILGGLGPAVFMALGWLLLMPTVLAAGMEGLKWWVGKKNINGGNVPKMGTVVVKEKEKGSDNMKGGISVADMYKKSYMDV